MLLVFETLLQLEKLERQSTGMNVTRKIHCEKCLCYVTQMDLFINKVMDRRAI